jgi:hypothetical protein
MLCEDSQSEEGSEAQTVKDSIRLNGELKGYVEGHLKIGNLALTLE